jgi:hypothetical protein
VSEDWIVRVKTRANCSVFIWAKNRQRPHPRDISLWEEARVGLGMQRAYPLSWRLQRRAPQQLRGRFFLYTKRRRHEHQQRVSAFYIRDMRWTEPPVTVLLDTLPALLCLAVCPSLRNIVLVRGFFAYLEFGFSWRLHLNRDAIVYGFDGRILLPHSRQHNSWESRHFTVQDKYWEDLETWQLCS